MHGGKPWMTALATRLCRPQAGPSSAALARSRCSTARRIDSSRVDVQENSVCRPCCSGWPPRRKRARAEQKLVGSNGIIASAMLYDWIAGIAVPAKALTTKDTKDTRNRGLPKT